MLRSPVTLDELRDLFARGHLRNGAGLELVAGVVLASPPPRAPVVAVVTELAGTLDRELPDHRVMVREAVALGEHDLLRPEVGVVRPVWEAGPAWRATGGGIPAAALALAVFVGEHEAPLRWRAHRCARAGVPEAWTVAVGEGTASRWRRPWEGRYRAREALAPGEAVELDAAPERAVVAWQRATVP